MDSELLASLIDIRALMSKPYNSTCNAEKHNVARTKMDQLLEKLDPGFWEGLDQLDQIFVEESN